MSAEIEDYILSHIDKEPEVLHELDRATNLRLVNGRMCSGHLQGRLLKMLVRMIRPRRILELGTFSGYSALCLAEGLEPGATVDTVEVADELEDFIRHWLGKVPWGERVTLHIGDACDIAASFPDGEFDLVFIDADKRRYPQYYAAVMPKVRAGGFLIADNTLWDNHVADPERNDAQTRGVKAFNDIVAADPAVEKVILPLRDGLTLIRKIPFPE